MKVVIVEDEVIAAQALERMLRDIRPDFEVIAVLQTVEDSVDWFTANPTPDIVFMDIHLADGSSFGIFDKASVDCPIIFITAYNEYALEAFEVNSIDYLLKPINKARLSKAISKFNNISYRSDNSEVVSRLLESFSEKGGGRKTHFLIPHKDKLIPLAVEEIAYFQADMKVALASTVDGHSYSVDYSLDEVMKNLDKRQFFRVNRQYIVSHRAVRDISIWFAGKLAVNLEVQTPERIFVSKARVPDFKKWFTRDI